MKLFLKNSFLILLFALYALFRPVYAQIDTEPVEAFKKEISKKHKLLNFETKTISAIYPSNTINRLGMNYPGYRGPGQLVVYYPGFDETTGTNEYGTEAVVENGTVVKLTGADSIIPSDGFVISGHGSSKKWIKDNLHIGTKIKVEGNVLIAYTTADSYVFMAKERIKEAEEFINNAKKSDVKTPEDKKAAYYLKKAKSEARKAEHSREKMKKEHALSSVELSNLAIKYALPYIEDEFKGVWLRPSERNVYEIRKTLDNIQKTGIKEIFLETYFHGYTIYPSKVMKEYGLTVQNPKFLMYDPLKAYIDEAHKRGMKIHIWFESFYIGNTPPSYDDKSILSKYPSWGNKNLANYDSKTYVRHKTEHNGYFLDPANPEVTTFLTELINEIANKYDIDGINLDYTRYPNSQNKDVPSYKYSNWGYTEFARKEFTDLYEVDPVEIEYDTIMWNKWDEYRREKIHNYVKQIHDALKEPEIITDENGMIYEDKKENTKDILLTAVIFPNYEVCLETKQQNWAKWSRENLIDGVTPLILTSDNELFHKILKDVKNRLSNKTKVYTGLFVGFLEAEPEDLLRQISVSRSLKSEGIILFDWAHLPVKYQNALRYRVFLPKGAKAAKLKFK